MAVISNFGGPGVSAGIPHPKMPYRFMVLFRGSAVDQSQEEELVVLMKHLTTQTVQVQLPKLQLSTLTPRKSTLNNFVRFGHEGMLELLVEDDVLNRTFEAIDTLSNGTMLNLNITVCMLDGNEGVLEAYDFRGVHFSSTQHSMLSYGAISPSTLNGEISQVTQVSADEPTKLQTMNLRATISNDKHRLVSQTVTAQVNTVHVARFNDKTLADLIKELS